MLKRNPLTYRVPQNASLYGQVVKITDTWEGNPLSLGLKHLIPGFWDMWHQLGSPPAEKQPYRVMKRTLGYAIKEYAPRLVTQPSLIDYSNSREVRGKGEEALVIHTFASPADETHVFRFRDECICGASRSQPVSCHGTAVHRVKRSFAVWLDTSKP